MSGKGDSPRPLSIPRDQFGAQFDAIFGKQKLCGLCRKPVNLCGCCPTEDGPGDGATMPCTKCGVDRLKQPCAGEYPCAMMARAYDQRRFNREGVVTLETSTTISGAVSQEHIAAAIAASRTYRYPSNIDGDITHETAAITTAVAAMADALEGCPLKDSLKVWAALDLAFKYGERRYVKEVFREMTLLMGGPDD